MSGHLLLITLGPVQDFIAQARRTRDLWFGSHLLSEVSRAAAAKLTQQGARLIFPALEANDEELLPSDGPLRPSGKPPLAVPNKLLAELPDGAHPEELARGAREAAEQRWLDFASKAQNRCRGLMAAGVEKAYDEQVRTFLEFTAAWVALSDANKGYTTAREAVEGEIAGRKLLHDFPAWNNQRGTVPKSSLDGGRETVIVRAEERPAHLVKRYHISSGEQLDAVGLVKRAGGEPDQFISVANVALAGWIVAAKDWFPDRMTELEAVCEREGIRRVVRPDIACGRVFAFDAEVFLKDQWTTLLSEVWGKPKDPRKAEAWGTAYVQGLLDEMNPPCPYVACMVADGDRMGLALQAVHDVDRHRRFSKHLSYFAERARKIVEQDHRGILIYAGGDDVLAFVGVAEALSCADSLRSVFEGLMREAFSGTDVDGEPPTLSVGIGIGHLMESMGQLRRLGQDAEKLAKTGRNALAMVVDKRSGGTTQLCEGWQDSPVSRLRSATTLLGTDLSMKKVYEIQREWSRMPLKNTLLPGEQPGWAELLRNEVERILARTSDGKGLTAAEVGLSWTTSEDYDTRHKKVEAWVSRMLMAKVVAEAISAARPKEER